MNGGGRSKRLGDARGASATEHVLLISVVALASLGAWGMLGDAVDAQITCAREALTGGLARCAPSSTTPARRDPTPPIVLARADTSTSASAPATGSIDDAVAFGRGFVGGVVDGATGFVRGVWDLGVGLAGGAANALTHPTEIAQTLGDAATHLDSVIPAAVEMVGRVGSALWHGVERAGDTLFHGTWEARGRLLGGATFEIATTFVPVSKLERVTELGRVVTRADDVSAAMAAARTTDEAAAAIEAARAAGSPRLVVGGGRADDYPRLEPNDISLDIDPAARPHVLGDINAPPLPDGSFAEVAYEAVPYDAFVGPGRTAIASTYRVLQPGGRLTIGTGIQVPVAKIVEDLERAGFRDVRARPQSLQEYAEYRLRAGDPEDEVRQYVEFLTQTNGIPGQIIEAVKPGP